MTNVNIFEVASRERFRFQYKGNISVEDLWALSVEELDIIFKGLNSKAKQAEEDSLLATKTKEDTVLIMKIEIVKHIVSVKLKEAEARKAARENKAQAQKIMAIIQDKKDAALKDMSVEDLQKELDKLQ